MINAKLNIIPIFFDHKEIKYKILTSEDSKFPNIIIEPALDINAALNHIISLYIDSEIKLNNFKLTDVVITEDYLDIYYILFINYETNLKNNATLLNIEDKLDIPNNAKKIIELL